jgi:hypothetical protein
MSVRDLIARADTLTLSAAVTTGAGSTVHTKDRGYVLWIVRVTGVTVGGTVLIQGCETDSGTAANWYTIGTVPITANGTHYVAVDEDEWHVKMRANVTVRTDGSYSASYLSATRMV